jgi:hypothetical protein
VEVVGSHHPYVHRQSERHHWWQRDLHLTGATRDLTGRKWHARSALHGGLSRQWPLLHARPALCQRQHVAAHDIGDWGGTPQCGTFQGQKKGKGRATC